MSRWNLSRCNLYLYEEMSNVKSAALSCWWERKRFTLHFSHSLKRLAFYVISFSTWQRSDRDRWHFKSRWYICCARILNSLHIIWVCSNSTALNLCCSSCGTVFQVGCFSPPPLKQRFKILSAIITFVLHAEKRIFRRLLSTQWFMEYWMAFSSAEGCFSDLNFLTLSFKIFYEHFNNDYNFL